MATSQRQIAERLGVSITLVSRVLSGKARAVGIAEATIQRVLAAATEMGYVPSAAALTLKGKASQTIGVVVYDFLDPFFGSIIEQLQAQAHTYGYSLVLTGFKSRHPEASDLAPLHKHAIDGLIILGSDAQANWLDGFSALPVARIGHGSAEEASICIAVDEDDAARQLLRHHRAANHRRLVFIGEHLPAHRLRAAALERRAEREGCELRQILSPLEAFDAGEQSAQAILRESSKPDAFVCATDTIAMGALHALHDAGESIAVTGFDDIPAAHQFIPPITTLRQPIGEMARRAFEAILSPTEPSEKVLVGTLIARSSS